MGLRARERSGATAVVAMAALLVIQGTAHAAGSIQEYLHDDGEGGMLANGMTNPPGQTWSWEICPEGGGPCSPFGAGQSITTAGAPANVFFHATSNFGADTVSRVWRGTVSPLGPPSASGVIRANELVTPVAGTWLGGWDGDLDRFQLAACDTAVGGGCTSLTHTHYVDACAGGGAVLDPHFTGKFLRMADRRFGAESAEPAYGVGSPYGFPPWAAGPTISAAMLGQIAPATGPRRVRCGAPPVARASISKAGVATVRCTFGCRARLVARSGDERAAVARRIKAYFRPRKSDDELQLRLSRRAIDSLGPGLVRMTVTADGDRAARRTVVLD